MAEYLLALHDVDLELWYSDEITFAGTTYDPPARPSPPLPASVFSSPTAPYWSATETLGAAHALPTRLVSGWVDTTGAPIAPGSFSAWYGTAQDGLAGQVDELPIPREQIVSLKWRMRYTLTFGNDANWDGYPDPPARPVSVNSSVRIYPAGASGADTNFGAQLGLLQVVESSEPITVEYILAPSEDHWALLELGVDARRIGFSAPSPIVPVGSQAVGGITFVQSPGEQVSFTMREAALVLEYVEPATAKLDLTRARFS